MAEPREYRIVANLKAALQAIAVADGYYYGVDDHAVRMDPDLDVEALLSGPTAPRPFILLEPRPEEWQYHPAGEVRFVLPVTVHWVHDPADPADRITGAPSPLTDDERLRAFWRGCADVEKALAVDPGRGMVDGTSNAVDTRITNRAWQPTGGQLVWAELQVEIIVYRTFGAPA